MKKFKLLVAPLLLIPVLASCNKGSAITYHVKFTNGNEVVSEKDYKENEEIVAPADPESYEKDHKIYTFDAWYDGDTKYEAGLKATKNYNFEAKFTITNIYHVKFANGDEVVSEKDYKENETIVAPETPVKPDGDHKVYVFDGWYDNDVKYQDGLTATRDYNFEAKFNGVDAYEMTFYESDETTKFKTICIPKTDPVLTLPDHSAQPGYFGEWYCDEYYTSYRPGETEEDIEEDLTFIWNENLIVPYTMTFYDSDGTTKYGDEIIVTNENPKFIAPSHPLTDPSRVGKWRYDIEESTNDYYGYIDPGEEADLTSIVFEDLCDVDFVWNELNVNKVEFEDENGNKLPDLTILIEETDWSITLPDALETQSGWCGFWSYNGRGYTEYYSPNGAFTLDIGEPKDYEFKWATFEIQEYTMRFYNDDDKTDLFETIEVTTDDPSFTLPEHGADEGQWKYQISGMPSPQYEYPGVTLMLPPNELQDYDFVWTPDAL